jgi:8-oxo-dGTP pyrophosphatase MutT (NUDIX family)
MGAESAELIAYRNSRPGKRMGAGALIRDTQGRVLIVEPAYKSAWEVPGGAVDADESPRGACEREVTEELGLRLVAGRLLCMEWQGPEPDRTESLMFIYDGGVLDKQTITLAASELTSYAFVDSEDLDQYVAPRLSRRLRAALLAIERGDVLELEHGHLVDTAPVISR